MIAFFMQKNRITSKKRKRVIERIFYDFINKVIKNNLEGKCL
ncbi:hypothetical protein OKW22_000493 [Bacilli bacterium PM5-3]|nr:hypothetical protein [Bacilli bacterium PM5-3]MDH6604312.1 hypothetical protein [Bacilli bacterium PM5-9]